MKTSNGFWKQVLIEQPDKDLQTNLTNYIESIRKNSSTGKHKKVTVLLTSSAYRTFDLGNAEAREATS